MASPEFIKCALWIMHHGRMQMAKRCERPRVQLGSETCGHFLGQPQENHKKPIDVSDKCRRSQIARKLPPIGERA